jgi:hypothetical protein
MMRITVNAIASTIPSERLRYRKQGCRVLLNHADDATGMSLYMANFSLSWGACNNRCVIAAARGAAEIAHTALPQLDPLTAFLRAHSCRPAIRVHNSASD